MATKKRLPKQQREEQEIKALTQRLTDIYSGAFGERWSEEDMWPGTDDLCRIVPAVKAVFADQIEYPWPFADHNLDKYESPSALAKHLHGAGIRA